MVKFPSQVCVSVTIRSFIPLRFFAFLHGMGVCLRVGSLLFRPFPNSIWPTRAGYRSVAKQRHFIVSSCVFAASWDASFSQVAPAVILQYA